MLYRAILDKSFEVHFPAHLTPPLCDAVRGLLKFDPLNRLGCLTDGAEDVKRHAFFASEDWPALLKQERPPPFVPPLTSAVDTSNFDEALDDAAFLTEPPYDYTQNEWDRDF